MKKTLSIILIGLVTTTQLVLGTARTLHGGMSRFSMTMETLSELKAAGETFNANGVGNKDFKFYDAKSYTAKNISTLQPFIQARLMNPDSIILDSVELSTVDIMGAYGITDDLTIVIDLPYKKRKLTYNAAYIAAISRLDTLASTGRIPGKTAADFAIPPREAKGEGFSDITVALKYRLRDDLAIGAGYRGGFLKIGRDAHDIAKKTDGFEELATGTDIDKYSLKIYYDLDLLSRPVELSATYDYFSEGSQIFLDNNLTIKNGDEFTVDAYTDFNLLEDTYLTLGLTYRYSLKDKKKDAQGNWQAILPSNLSALLAEIKLSGYLLRFLNLSISAHFPLINEPIDGAYDFPGRLSAAAIYRLSTQVYF